ncbi:patatin-like phospholipase family protein [Hydrogenimonas sp.]
MKVALALSGGGIRAMAHLGVVHVLQRHGFEIGALSGSSGGALVGALLCDGKSPEEVVAIMKELRLRDLAGTSENGGFFGLERIERLLDENLRSKRIEEMPIPFTVACTDLKEGCVRYFDRGVTATLCAASSSLVPVFSPVRYAHMLLADGGFMDNMPTKPLRRHRLPIVGINVNPIPPTEPSGIVGTTIRVLMLMMAANIEASRSLADVYIEPEGCGAINIFDLKRGDAAYKEGVRAAEGAIDRIVAAVDRFEKN